MDDGNPENPQPQDPAEDSQPTDNGLVSKLARAYGSLSPEQRRASSLPSGDPLANPELEDRFQKLLKELEVLGAHQEHRDHKADPRTVALLEKKIEELQARGDSAPDEGASARPAPAASVVPGGKQCGKCGQVNSAITRFCGMCGAELTRSSGVDGKGDEPAASAAPIRREPRKLSPPSEQSAESRSRRGFKIGFLVLLLAVLALLVSQQWPSWRQRLLANWIARGFNTLPATSAPLTTAPAPGERPANPPVSSRAPGPAPAASKPSKAAQKTPPKPAPPTIIKQPLPGPVPLTSALPELPSETSATVAQPDQGAPAAAPASQPLPQRARVAQGVAQAGLISKVDPEYPPVARMARVQGSVVLHAIIGTDGTVQHLQVVSGNPLLVGPALNAVKNWRYRPYLVDGQPVEVETTVTVNFKGE